MGVRARIVALVGVLFLVSVLRGADKPRQMQTAKYGIVIRGPEGYAVRVPVLVKVRSRSGKILAERTGAEDGRMFLSVSWTDEDPPEQVEATLPKTFEGWAIGS